MFSASLVSVDITEFHKTVELSSLGLTTVKYNIKKLPRREEEWVIVGVRPNTLTQWEKM